VIVVILLVSGVMVVNMEALRKGSRLNEAVERLQQVFRFARAEAMLTGHRLLIELRTGETQTELTMTNLTPSPIQIFWEPQPLEQPGVFVPYRHPLLESTDWARWIRILEVVKAPSWAQPVRSGVQPTSVASLPDTEGSLPVAHDVYIFPDGLCDSVELVVAAADPEEDSRLFRIRVHGMTGQIEVLPLTEEEWLAESEPASSSPLTSESGSTSASSIMTVPSSSEAWNP